MERNLLAIALLVITASAIAVTPATAHHDENGCSIPPWITVLPNNPCLAFPLICQWINDPLCNGHDNCYQHEQNCGRLKAQCDSDLLETIEDLCRTTYSGVMELDCLAQAQLVYLGVAFGGAFPALEGLLDVTGDEGYALQNPGACPNGVTNKGVEGILDLDYSGGYWYVDLVLVGYGGWGQQFVQGIMDGYPPEVILDTPDGVVTTEICWGQLVEVKGQWVCQ